YQYFYQPGLTQFASNFWLGRCLHGLAVHDDDRDLYLDSNRGGLSDLSGRICTEKLDHRCGRSQYQQPGSCTIDCFRSIGCSDLHWLDAFATVSTIGGWSGTESDDLANRDHYHTCIT